MKQNLLLIYRASQLEALPPTSYQLATLRRLGWRLPPTSRAEAARLMHRLRQGVTA